MQLINFNYLYSQLNWLHAATSKLCGSYSLLNCFIHFYLVKNAYVCYMYSNGKCLENELLHANLSADLYACKSSFIL